MYRKIVNEFKKDIFPAGKEEDVVRNKAVQVGKLYSKAIQGTTVSDVFTNFAKARLLAENLKLSYIRTEQILPDELKNHFDMANQAVSHLLYEIVGEEFSNVLEKIMLGILDSEFEPRSVVKTILSEMDVEDVTI